MIEIKPVNINKTTAIGVKIGNPEFPEKPAISVLLANRGLIVCRNFDTNALDKRRVAVARVMDLTRIEDALDANIESCTSKAKALGIVEGIMEKKP